MRLPLLLLLLAASFGQAGDWPIFRGDPGLRGLATGELAANPRLVWHLPTGQGACTSPVVAGQRVFVANGEGKLLALDLATGKAIWSVPLGSPTEAPPFVAGDRVYIGTDAGRFLAFAAADGKPLWSFAAEDRIKGSANAVQAGDTPAIVFGSYDMFLYCLDAATGKLLWKLETDNYINGTPAVTADHIAFGACDGQFRQVDAKTGQIIRATDAESYIPGTAALADGSAFFGQTQGEIRRLDLAKGSIVWTNTETRDGVFSPPAVGRALVLCGARDGKLHALDHATGKAAWAFRAGREIDGGAVICGDRVAVGSAAGRLHLLDLATGHERWSYDLGSPVSTSPAISDGWLLVGTDSGVLYAFR